MSLSWQPIDTAPRDGSVRLVNDTNEGTPPWVAAKWLQNPEWSGWIYDDETLCDLFPLGPKPTAWLDVPPVNI